MGVGAWIGLSFLAVAFLVLSAAGTIWLWLRYREVGDRTWWQILMWSAFTVGCICALIALVGFFGPGDS